MKHDQRHPARLELNATFTQDAGDVNDPRILAVRLAVLSALVKALAKEGLEGGYRLHSKIRRG